MELYWEILIKAIESGCFSQLMPEWKEFAEGIVEGVCYQALLKIKAIVENDCLSDEDCFEKIEEIVAALEEIGSGGGTRHDFG